MPRTEIQFKQPTEWGMLHVKKAHILNKGWHFCWEMVQQHTAEPSMCQQMVW